MDTASYFLTPNVEQRLTKLYRSDGVTPYPYWHIAYRAAGSVNASAKEMANYVRFCLQRGGFDGTFEGTTVVFVGTAATTPFRAYLLQSPPRIVLDVAHAS